MLMFVSSSTHPNAISLNGALKIVIGGQRFVISRDNMSRPKSETTEAKGWKCHFTAWVDPSRSSDMTLGNKSDTEPHIFKRRVRFCLALSCQDFRVDPASGP